MIEKLSNNEGVKQSQSAAGQRELLRGMRNRLNEIIDSVNDHEDMLYGCGCDDDDDMGFSEEVLNGDAVCPDCRSGIPYTLSIDDNDEETFTPSLVGFSHVQLEAIRDEANNLLERRSQDEMKDDGNKLRRLVDRFQALEEEHDMPVLCIDQHIAVMRQKTCEDILNRNLQNHFIESSKELNAAYELMDDRAGKIYTKVLLPNINEAYLKDDQANTLKRVDTTDGLFSDFTAYVAAHPGLRLYQALRNWSGYSTIYGIDGVKPINLDTLEDTFYLKRKGPKA